MPDNKLTTGKQKSGNTGKYSQPKAFSSRIKLNVFGRQPVLEALRSDVKVQNVWLAEDLQGQPVQQIQNMASNREIPLQIVAKNNIQKIVGAVVHQGVAAEVYLKTIPDEQALLKFLESKDNPLLLVLDQVQDPHNLGAILRTAEVSGVDALIMPFKGSADITATVAKTSAGALFHLPIYRSRELLETFSNLQSMNVKIIATLPRTESVMYETDFKQACAIVVGNEGLGVRKNLLHFCDQAVYIPQHGRINSLNASVSTAVILYEALRQRKAY